MISRILALTTRFQQLRFLHHHCSLMNSNNYFGSVPIETDIYKGCTVDTKNLHLSDDEFEETLAFSISNWTKSGARGIWFKVNIENSSYIPLLVKHGFQFHHSKTAHLMLTRWLPEDQPNLLPQYPFTHIGVGGMVINDKNEVLTIQERYQSQPLWKLPGGYSDPGEEFADTAKREVFEETGVDTDFVSVVSFRHHHKHIFGCSDIYVICHLKPKSCTIRTSKEEIGNCEWMNVETYRNHPHVSEFNRMVMDEFLKSQRLGVSIVATPVLSLNRDRHNLLYHIESSKNS